ncbi:hypothetical protein K443DRAFT_349017 [Laccaria amethystina LaAM-08-1]|uniref:Uncharacterized protein n=1 Tax=Laccaria amethystina LaAM-08-1 TaxID=1095629 RepID=A0A0C9WSQ1_9AGAR|nr:hypothetical protein K443DRAFT_349017 [Laccaria amethystina LaAM-08-1]
MMMLPRRQSAAFRIIEIMGNYILQSPDLFVMLAATPPRKLSLMAALATRLLRTSDAPYGMIELLNDRVTPQRMGSLFVGYVHVHAKKKCLNSFAGLYHLESVELRLQMISLSSIINFRCCFSPKTSILFKGANNV